LAIRLEYCLVQKYQSQKISYTNVKIAKSNFFLEKKNNFEKIIYGLAVKGNERRTFCKMPYTGYFYFRKNPL